MIAFAMKLVGLGKIWEKIDGTKTYIQGAAEILTGLGGMALSSSVILTNFVNTVHSLGDTVNFVQGMVSKLPPEALAITAAWGVVLHGWSVIAKKSSEDKKHDELVAATAAAAGTVPAPATPEAPAPAPVPPAAPAPAASEAPKP